MRAILLALALLVASCGGTQKPNASRSARAAVVATAHLVAGARALVLAHYNARTEAGGEIEFSAGERGFVEAYRLSRASLVTAERALDAVDATNAAPEACRARVALEHAATDARATIDLLPDLGIDPPAALGPALEAATRAAASLAPACAADGGTNG